PAPLSPPLCHPARPPARSTPFPYTTLFRSGGARIPAAGDLPPRCYVRTAAGWRRARGLYEPDVDGATHCWVRRSPVAWVPDNPEDRKSTRLNSSHVKISYAVFCLKKKNNGY